MSENTEPITMSVRLEWTEVLAKDEVSMKDLAAIMEELGGLFRMADYWAEMDFELKIKL